MDGSVQEHEHMPEIDEWLRKERENAQTVHLGNGDKRESTPKCETKGKANLGKKEGKEVDTGRFGTEEHNLKKVKC